MTKEQWEIITANWGTQDPAIMEQIGKIKDEDAITLANLEKAVADRDNTIRELTQQNVDLNKTNMNLILRLTDPAITPEPKVEDPEESIPAISDLDSFIKED